MLAALVLFICIGFQLGTFQLPYTHYASHTLTFKHSSGLAKKAEVKIAGVKVGWVENIILTEQDQPHACVEMRIDESYTLYKDAHGIIRQDGLLGPSYLEIIPGNPTIDMLSSGESLNNQHVEPVALDELLRTIKNIASDIQDMTHAFKQSFQQTHMVQDAQSIMHDLSGAVKQLHTEVLPSFQQNVSAIAQACDRDFSSFAERVAATTDTIQEASTYLKEGFKHINDVAQDIKNGTGSVGKLIKDDQVYQNLSYTMDRISTSFRRFSDLFMTYDGHVENMFERAEHTCFKDLKGIFNVRIYPQSDYFYLVGVTTSQKGYITRKVDFREYTDKCLNEICFDQLDLPDWAKYQYIFNTNNRCVKRNAYSVDLQFGKLYKNLALRIGLIEGTAGVAADLFIPYKNHYGIISTFKIYDLHGQNRIDDERPHLKWINRMFIFNHVYVAFGFDDFVSRCNRSFFLGAGFRFADDDLKWFAPNYVGT